MKIKSEDNERGFNFGAAKVERICCNSKTGAVWIGVRTKKQEIQIYVTKTGKVRISHQKVLTNENDTTGI